MEKYPNNLPPIPLSNNLEVCVNCSAVWIDPCDGKPDFNHCNYMVNPLFSPDRLSPQQREELYKIREKVQCPFYSPKLDTNSQNIAK